MATLEHFNLDDIDFDALDEAGLNALPVGLIRLDAQGVVTFYSQAETKNSGRAAARCLGRNFFLDLAPCANIPACFGRFQSFLAENRARDSFDFFFTFYVPRLRALIDFRAAKASGETWMIIRPIEVLTEYRDVDALRLVEAAVTRSAGQSLDTSSCDREEIHIPDAVQPHGALIVLDSDLEQVTAFSENLQQHLGLLGPVLLGGAATMVFSQNFLRDLSVALPLMNSSHSGSIDLGPDQKTFDFLAHRGDGEVLIELEPTIGDSVHAEPFLVSKFLSLLTSRIDLAFGRDHVAQMVVREVRALTEFDRVIVYRFDESGDGEVIAEAKAADWEQSFMGLRFPASDIPIQARRLYRRSRLRHLPDNDYLPSPLIKARSDAPPIDLSQVRLRSISPVHREYHRNMGVAATFSASIMAAGELWGLVIGHHRAPKRLGFRIRQGVGLAADLIGPHLVQEETIEQMSLRTEHEQVHRRLLEELARSENLLESLISGPVSLADLFLDSYGAVCRLGGQTHLVGHTPEAPVVERILAWLGETMNDEVWATDCVGEHLPDLFPHREIVSGLLAVSLDRENQDMIVWFRPEVSRTIAWAGNPRGKTSEAGMILPRKGFEQWIEQTNGHSRPWPAWKLDLARRLRNAVLEVIAAQSVRLRKLNEQLSDANETKRRLLAEMSHDFRTMLTDVIGFAEALQSGIYGPVTERQQEYLGDVAQTGVKMMAMIAAVLNAAAIETPAARPGEFLADPSASQPRS